MTEQDKKTEDKKSGSSFGRRRRQTRGRRQNREKPEFDQKILDLARVTRVTAGGKRMRFRCMLVIGDRKGRVGLGIAKGADVAISVEKAFRQAKKNIINISLVDETFPHVVREKLGAAKILLKPAPRGTGLKAGGAIRVMLDLGGVPNAVGKNLGTDNKINIAKATLSALSGMRNTVKDSGKKKDKKSVEEAAVEGAKKLIKQ
jgi:small subunit ribosomal protein S5